MTIFRIPVTITNTLPGGPFMNIFHARTIGPAGDDADQLGDALDALEEFYMGLRAYMPNGSVVRFGEGMIRDPLGAPEYQADDPRVIPTGTQLDGSPTPLLAIVVSWRTASASRSGRGRTFIGPLNSSAITTDGTPTNAVVDSIRAQAVGLVNSSGGAGGWSFGVLSVKQGVLRDFTGSSVRDRWSFLSSRRD
jgi:hypothetical protein